MGKTNAAQMMQGARCAGAGKFQTICSRSAAGEVKGEVQIWELIHPVIYVDKQQKTNGISKFLKKNSHRQNYPGH